MVVMNETIFSRGIKGVLLLIELVFVGSKDTVKVVVEVRFFVSDFELPEVL